MLEFVVGFVKTGKDPVPTPLHPREPTDEDGDGDDSLITSGP